MLSVRVLTLADFRGTLTLNPAAFLLYSSGGSRKGRWGYVVHPCRKASGGLFCSIWDSGKRGGA
nr:MAG TPA: hypothetical protein [Caudoviricetes sp.]